MSSLSNTLWHRDPLGAWSRWTPGKGRAWNYRLAAHLLRRGGFGATPDEIHSSVQLGLDRSLDQLFSMRGQSEFETEMRPLERVLTSSQDPRQLASWWLLRMLKTPNQLLEKTTLFWHGHFATSADKVENSRAMLAQNRLLRDNALGNFEPMVQGISRDVAMLIYLDSTQNRKTRPNENYARELMELFCLGPGNYSETDIKELARCFTGWEVQRGVFRFNKYQHDNQEKSLLGQRGNFSGEEAVKIVLQHPAAPRFIARKLIRFFVVEDFELTDQFCDPIADELTNCNFDVAKTLQTIFSSRFFYSDAAIGHKVRSPVEMAIGLMRTLDASGNMNQLSERLRVLGHLPLFPPNVKGWDGGRNWINASTYFGRANLVRDIVTSNETTFAGGTIVGIIDARKRKQPAAWVRDLADTLLAVSLPEASIKQLTLLASGKGKLEQRISNVIAALGATPEFQLV